MSGTWPVGRVVFGVLRAVSDGPGAVSSGGRAVSGRLRISGRVRDYRLRDVFGVASLAAVYYGAAHLGYAFEFAGPVAAVIWLPVGVGIAFLYLGGLRLWPGVLVGDLLVNNYSAVPVSSALGQTLGNVLEVLVATLLIRQLVPRGSPLASVANLTRLLVAIAAGTAVSATVGTVALRLGHVVTTSSAPSVWRTWWLGDTCGALVVVPLALAWFGPLRRPRWNGRMVEWALLLAAVAGLSEVALDSHRPRAYLVFPALIWAALRFGQRGATLAITVVVGFAVWETTHYVGPFVDHSLMRSVLSTQLYIAVAALSTLCLAAVVSEREELAERLSASRARLVEAADTERRRLEHNLHDGAQQRLTALAVRLEIASERARQEPGLAAAAIGEAQTELSLAIDELRKLAHGIHPAVLTRFGLARAIETVAERSTVPIEVLELPLTRVDPAAEATAYYVFVEALTNAQKHAHASSIWVRAAVARRTLHIEIVDDGVGGAVESGNFGLQGLRDRVEGIGGMFELDSVPAGGTRVAAAIPATASAG
jgi:signal transduction histidine kinase